MEVDEHVEENLREAAACGNEEAVELLLAKQVNVNSQNAINGWSALHWACKRSHRNIAQRLLQHGANPTLLTQKGETCLDFASDPEIRLLLGGTADGFVGKGETDLPIIPNYLANPVFPHTGAERTSNVPPDAACKPSTDAASKYMLSTIMNQAFKKPGSIYNLQNDELVLKVRLANIQDRDFIEIELPRSSLTFDLLVSTMCSELAADRSLVVKVRKLPDTIIRKDKDVCRLFDYQELELVLASRANAEVFHGYKAAVAPKHIDVIY